MAPNACYAAASGKTVAPRNSARALGADEVAVTAANQRAKAGLRLIGAQFAQPRILAELNGEAFIGGDGRSPCERSATRERGRVDGEISKSGHILVADEDPTLRRTIISYLEDHNVPASAASSQCELRHRCAVIDPCLIILDLRLGEHGGFDLLKDIRSRSDVPIIVMAGQRCDETDRVVGLELGADDCITKPFGLRELLARVRAVLRRQEMGRAARVRDPERGGYRFNGWQLRRRDRRLLDQGGTPIALTKGEYALLLAFVKAPQRPLTRAQLLQATRIHEDICDRSIDIRVLRLRRKLETDPSAPQVIQTERGVGYVFAPPVEPF
jgi:two-component system OmpR family response regulator